MTDQPCALQSDVVNNTLNTPPHPANWLYQAGWGVWIHYLTNEQSPEKSRTSSEMWNRMVDGFEVQRLADQLAAVGAGYLIFTVGQGSGHYCAPNEAYDQITGVTPSKCSQRDLIGDLAEALSEHNISLIAYAPCDGPWDDPQASEAFEFKRLPWSAVRPPVKPEYRLAAFQLKWQRVLREWSLRWGDRVRGWWIDGCYFDDQMYQHDDEPNFASFAKALRAGNPHAIVAFNPGVKIKHCTEHEDYTAGESDYLLPVAPGQFTGRFVEHKPTGHRAQLHVSSFLGRWWCQSPPRFDDAFAIAYTRHVRACGGVMTWDVPVQRDGLIPEIYIHQLKCISKHGSA